MERQKFAGRHAHIEIQGAATAQVVEALDAFCAAEQVPDEAAWRLRVALDEIVANIVRHGSRSSQHRRPGMDVWFRANSGVAEVTVADDSPPFNPLLQPEPDLTLPLEARQPGGLGISLVKSLMDSVDYEWADRNVLTIKMQFGPEGRRTPYPNR